MILTLRASLGIIFCTCLNCFIILFLLLLFIIIIFLSISVSLLSLLLLFFLYRWKNYWIYSNEHLYGRKRRRTPLISQVLENKTFFWLISFINVHFFFFFRNHLSSVKSWHKNTLNERKLKNCCCFCSRVARESKVNYL